MSVWTAHSALSFSGLSNRDLFADLEFKYGDSAVLSGFFEKAAGAIDERGIALSFEPLEFLIHINAANSKTWRPLIPLFDVRHGIDPASAFCIVGRNAEGEVVATQAARLYNWNNTCFSREAEALRLFYANPLASRRNGEACRVTAPSAQVISGRVVFSGAGWYRPDYRKQWLSGLLPRISRALAYTRWDTDYTISIMADAVIKGGMAERCGYTNVEYEVELQNGPVGNVSCALVWMATDQLLADLERFCREPIPGGVPRLAEVV
jgi:hypothetical protein